MSEFSQTVPELVAGHGKMISLFRSLRASRILLAIATLNGERLDGEMSEGELVDAFRHVSRVLNRRMKRWRCAPTMRSTTWCASAC